MADEVNLGPFLRVDVLKGAQLGVAGRPSITWYVLGAGRCWAASLKRAAVRAPGPTPRVLVTCIVTSRSTNRITRLALGRKSRQTSVSLTPYLVKDVVERCEVGGAVLGWPQVVQVVRGAHREVGQPGRAPLEPRKRHDGATPRGAERHPRLLLLPDYVVEVCRQPTQSKEDRRQGGGQRGAAGGEPSNHMSLDSEGLRPIRISPLSPHNTIDHEGLRDPYGHPSCRSPKRSPVHMRMFCIGSLSSEEEGQLFCGR